ncbi:EAL domain-containing protein [Coralloluteibacterium stylophorae]|uniref:cyclic-guanylate-specific phosphodiesterase n=1 Tax=Coralloluteibacterium stylophorae TaxID=1776034 RepID=A0A8J7VV57_9GAMM|nr:EAL domain-containing protein [Coralloluteibacterium stylophorae]MBS7455616.1 EAL domain-containing protein [Coralloluteibacterium stylophorae]
MTGRASATSKHMIALLAAAGFAFGAALTVLFVHAAAAGAAREALADYAGTLLVFGRRIAAESETLVREVAASPGEACSAEDLQHMRTLLFGAALVRDVGRIRDDALVCSAALGRLPTPVPMPAPDLVTPGRRAVSVGTTTLVPGDEPALVLRIGDVGAVINPNVVRALDRAGMDYSLLIVDRARRRMVLGDGRDLGLDVDTVLDRRHVSRNGMLYEVRCPPPGALCVAAAAAAPSLIGQGQGVRLAWAAGGGMLGAAFALALVPWLRRRRAPEAQLRQAIRRGDIDVVYQPLVDVTDGRIVGVEALARWESDEGPVPPDVFVPLAEQHGFVGELTRLVVRRSLAELGARLRTGDLHVGINVAAADFLDETFPDWLQRQLDVAGVPAEALAFELTERSTADHANMLATITALRARGHRIYLDDFGTGYSSLSYLSRLHFDAVKLDRAFTHLLGSDALTASIVPQILAMIDTLDTRLVVEGVETFAQAEFLAKARPGALAQGWYYGKPMPAEALLVLLGARREG